jgi:hypothetical protein
VELTNLHVTIKQLSSMLTSIQQQELFSEYGFVPIGNEHDGLITIGEIPKEAIDGMPYLNLREKPFL